MNVLDKPCTGFRCDKADRCRHYALRPVNTFDYMSPLALRDECPHYDPRNPTWGDGPDKEDE